jgi:hypothetical protein
LFSSYLWREHVLFLSFFGWKRTCVLVCKRTCSLPIFLWLLCIWEPLTLNVTLTLYVTLGLSLPPSLPLSLLSLSLPPHPPPCLYYTYYVCTYVSGGTRSPRANERLPRHVTHTWNITHTHLNPHPRP